MKSIIKILMLLGVLVLFFSCNDNDYELGEKLSPSELNFSVVQDYSADAGGNTVILTNNTPGTVAVWDYQTGTSNKNQVVVNYAFAGEYTIKFSAVTAGGIVEAESVIITVTDDNYNYVTDPLWETLSGGVGNTKKWYLDLDADGLSRYFTSPLYFYGTDNGWLEGGDAGCYGDDCWTWAPVWESNQWIMDAADYGYMEFSLDGGPFVTVDHLTLPALGTQSGTYSLDVESYTLAMSNAGMLHNTGYDDCVSNWGNITLFSLTEDTMQLGVIREAIGACSSEGQAMIVYNFISEEYRDNWIPEETGPVEPILPDDWENTVSEITSTSIEWKLSENNPIDWANLDGSMMNGWQVPGDYPDWLGAPDPSVYGDFSMTINSSDNSVVFVTPDGTTTEGTYEINSSGIYSFSIDVPSFQLINWAYFAPDSNNQLRILNITTDSGGNITDMWLGAVDDVNNPSQYTAFHLEPTLSDGGSEEETGIEISVNNSLIAYGDIESNGNLRLEIFNEYGTTLADPPINTADMVFDDRVEVTFTISGTGISGGSYDASMYYADSDWAPNGNGAPITVTGDGTYTVTYQPGTAVNGCIVFVIDIVGMGNDIADISSVSATIDNIMIYN
ncbi:hypothetical protein [Abyssalbus ytuae]|uniref:PKD domain-containing protein n=1 Tax=Abyssalbus ytuae TaxID=2926907 RepID=A0A9E6ZPW7_9FLAO|nr:hypothetical protein [Abyssalbus ytuae]UOB18739.1 hypothetical protein MQE35_05465 [Abyssalbus ytuae]